MDLKLILHKKKKITTFINPTETQTNKIKNQLITGTETDHSVVILSSTKTTLPIHTSKTYLNAHHTQNIHIHLRKWYTIWFTYRLSLINTLGSSGLFSTTNRWVTVNKFGLYELIKFQRCMCTSRPSKTEQNPKPYQILCPTPKLYTYIT